METFVHKTLFAYLIRERTTQIQRTEREGGRENCCFLPKSLRGLKYTVLRGKDCYT